MGMRGQRLPRLEAPLAAAPIPNAELVHRRPLQASKRRQRRQSTKHLRACPPPCRCESAPRQCQRHSVTKRTSCRMPRSHKSCSHLASVHAATVSLVRRKPDARVIFGDGNLGGHSRRTLEPTFTRFLRCPIIGAPTSHPGRRHYARPTPRRAQLYVVVKDIGEQHWQRDGESLNPTRKKVGVVAQTVEGPVTQKEQEGSPPSGSRYRKQTHGPGHDNFAGTERGWLPAYVASPTVRVTTGQQCACILHMYRDVHNPAQPCILRGVVWQCIRHPNLPVIVSSPAKQSVSFANGGAHAIARCDNPIPAQWPPAARIHEWNA